jgi:glutathione peroxidase
MWSADIAGSDGMRCGGRRRFLMGMAGLGLSAFAMPFIGSAQARMSRISAHSFSFDGIDGGRIHLEAFRGRPVLVVNTASRCGFTHQYEGLQRLHERFSDAGLVVIGVPSNDFRQELSSNQDVAAFCQSRFGVTFPLTAITPVTGADAHPFYRWAQRERPGEGPRWNFHKYLIAPDGSLDAVFGTPTSPEDPRVIAAIEALLPGGS